MTTQIRELLQTEEQQAAHALRGFVFGRSTPFEDRDPADPVRGWGLFEDDELTATAGVRPYEQWFGGRAVPMGGICGVAVAPESRGGGRAQQLMSHALERMRDAGQVISALYPTAVGLYRSVGWEFGGMWPRVKVRTSHLCRARGGEDVTIRKCTEADIPEVERLYTAFARARNGMLTRTGPSFSRGAAQILTELDGVPLAIRGGEVVGYASYSRGSGWLETAEIPIQDLVGADAGATAALLRHFSAWSSVTSFCSLRLTPDDIATLVLPDMTAPPGERMRWMLRIVDVPGALMARGYRSTTNARVELEVHDAHASWNNGRYVLTVTDGVGCVEAGGGGGVRTDIRGLAALYSCAFDARALVRAGLLAADDGECEQLDTIFSGSPSIMWDFF